LSTLTAERALAPLDVVRRHALLLLGPLGGPLIRDRELRVALTGCAAVALALVTTAAAPLWAMALGPVLLGVPHLMADVRYLVVRPGLHRRKLLVLCAGAPLLLAALNLGVLAGLLACAAALLVARTSPGRRIAGLLCVAALAWAAALAGQLADLAFAHLHNFCALAFFWLWRPRTQRLHALPLILFALAAAALLLGGLDSLWTVTSHWAPAGLTAGDRLDALAPGLPQLLASRLVLLFAFAQTVHYAVWLRLLPEEDRARRTPRSFAASFRALKADFGALGLAACALLALAIAGWAAFDLAEAHDGYLRLAVFHGHLELAALALLFAEGRNPSGTNAVRTIELHSTIRTQSLSTSRTR
jgi:hypothetical protein